MLIEGMVASPTPTIPISSDSTSVTENRGMQKRANAAAVIHPAVPPPTTTIRSLTALPMSNFRVAHRRRQRAAGVARAQEPRSPRSTGAGGGGGGGGGTGQAADASITEPSEQVCVAGGGGGGSGGGGGGGAACPAPNL